MLLGANSSKILDFFIIIVLLFMDTIANMQKIYSR